MALEESRQPDGRQTPYQLDLVQTTQASKVLLNHISTERQRRQASRTTRNLLSNNEEDDDDDEDQNSDVDQEPIWLILTTKKHIIDQKRLKPSKIPLPHPINTSPTSSICLITADPQKTYAALVASSQFPAELRKRISRTISLITLKKTYNTFESRRALYAAHDIFLADDRIVTYLPGLLGKVFYKGGSKRPIPISLAEDRERGEDGKRIKLDPATARPAKDKENGGRGAATPERAGKEIVKALGSALVHLAPGTSTAVKVGLTGMSPEQLVDNISAVVNGLVDKFVTNRWRNVRAVHIKGPNSMSFPIWLASELWVDEEDILEEKKTFGKKKKQDQEQGASIEGPEADPKALPGTEKVKAAKRKTNGVKPPSAAKHAKKKRKLGDDGEDEDEDEKEDESKLAAEMASRKKRLSQQKAKALATLA